jgi:hypothetical protein
VIVLAQLGLRANHQLFGLGGRALSLSSGYDLIVSRPT